jgi:hypothetical protein
LLSHVAFPLGYIPDTSNYTDADDRAPFSECSELYTIMLLIYLSAPVTRSIPELPLLLPRKEIVHRSNLCAC